MANRKHKTVVREKDCDTRPECDVASQPGPVREAGGTTGAGNLSPGGANRTGGATSGVDPDAAARRRKLKPSRGK